MAVFSHVLVPAGVRATKTNVSGASSAEVAVAKGALVLFVADAALNLRFGRTGMAAAANTDLLIPANTPMVFDFGDEYSSFRVFGTGNLYSQLLTRK
jgi:hypothetical protein